jgi:hypothetical protein
MERPKKTSMGTCPKCGGDNIEYSDLDYEGDYLIHECTCCDCHAFFREFEVLDYDGYEFDDVEYSRDGEKI